MIFAELSYYAGTKVADGEGGYTLTLSSPRTIHGIIQIYNGETELLARAEESIVQDSIVDAGDQYYRVIGQRGHARGNMRAYAVEATTKPMVAG